MSASKKPTIRKVLVYAAGLSIFVLASPRLPLYVAGASLAVLGELLRIWACGHLRKNQAVIQSGPYAHVKNPLYLGTFVIMVGCVIAASNPWDYSRYLLLVLLPLFLGVFFSYYLPYKFEVEGDRLRRRFGEAWEEYDRNVPDFVPRLTPYRGVGGSWNGKLVAENSEVSAAILLTLTLGLLAARMAFDGPF